MTFNYTMRLPADQYYLGPTPKDRIFLHHTAGGSAKSTFEWWVKDPQHIGTSYLIDRDGTIFEVFPAEGWAYHLGLHGLPVIDKVSLGIELCNWGWLVRQGEKFFTTQGHEVEADRVYKHPKPWRGSAQYFEAYPEAQVQAAIVLVDNLLTAHRVKRACPANYVEADEHKYRGFEGVLSHSHVRPDKTDVHPGFPWDKLVEGCKLDPWTSPEL